MFAGQNIEITVPGATHLGGEFGTAHAARQDNIIILQGGLNLNGVVIEGSGSVGTLPVGYRPKTAQKFIVATDKGARLLTVQMNGELILRADGDLPGETFREISFAGASFIAYF